MINKEKSTPRHIAMKWHNTKNEDLKNPREKSQGTYKEQTVSYQKIFKKKKKEYNNNLLVLTTPLVVVTVIISILMKGNSG